MPNTRNLRMADDLEAKFEQTRTLYLTDYRGLKVKDLAALRRQLREVGVDYRVSKNTLARIVTRHHGGIKATQSIATRPTIHWMPVKW